MRMYGTLLHSNEHSRVGTVFTYNLEFVDKLDIIPTP